MARAEVWNEVRTLFKLGAVKVVEARLFVAQDDTKPLPNAFRMLVSLRILGAQIDNDGTTNNFAVANGDVTIPVSVSTFQGNVSGAVGSWHGTDGNGSASTDESWARAEKVGFSLTAISRVTIPVSDILTLVPGIGGILRILLSALPGQKVSFALGQVDVDIPIHRRGDKVILPAGAVVPEWWPATAPVAPAV